MVFLKKRYEIVYGLWFQKLFSMFVCTFDKSCKHFQTKLIRIFPIFPQAFYKHMHVHKYVYMYVVNYHLSLQSFNRHQNSSWLLLLIIRLPICHFHVINITYEYLCMYLLKYILYAAYGLFFYRFVCYFKDIQSVGVQLCVWNLHRSMLGFFC